MALQQVVAEMRGELRGFQAREKRTRHLAFHDDLTAQPNRRFLRERLDRTLSDPARAPTLAVIYLDLDGFKALNDSYGHEIGHRLLNFVAGRLVHALWAEDFVSRPGGDEYACLITGVSSRDRLQGIATTLFKVVSQPFAAGTAALTVRQGLGIAIYPNDGTTAEALLKNADSAMYAAKRAKMIRAFAEPWSAI